MCGGRWRGHVDRAAARMWQDEPSREKVQLAIEAVGYRAVRVVAANVVLRTGGRISGRRKIGVPIASAWARN